MLRNGRKVSIAFLSLIIAGGICSTNSFVSHAEEVSVPGYHEYITTEDEAIDNWYGIAKGTYLKSGTSGLKIAGTRKVNVSGTTNAHSTCDKVKVGVYLDESSNGGSSFGTIGIYHFEETNTTSCHGSKSDISVTSGWKYRVRGVHSVQKGSTIETTDTCTATLTI